SEVVSSVSAQALGNKNYLALLFLHANRDRTVKCWNKADSICFSVCVINRQDSRFFEKAPHFQVDRIRKEPFPWALLLRQAEATECYDQDAYECGSHGFHVP